MNSVTNCVKWEYTKRLLCCKTKTTKFLLTKYFISCSETKNVFDVDEMCLFVKNNLYVVT